MACGELAGEGMPLVDVGTDHAYLPIWLLKNGKIPSAVAADIRPGPLEAARRNAEKYGVTQCLTLRLSDGLKSILPQEGQTVVMAGMGGELMCRIIGETPWLKEPGRRLVLQPMSCVPLLRKGLMAQGFSVEEERAIEDGGKVYSAFSVVHREVSFNEAPILEGELFLWMGRIPPGSPHSGAYAQKVLRELHNEKKGAVHQGDREKEEHLAVLSAQIAQVYL